MERFISDQIDELRSDNVHGAGWLSRKSIDILKMAVQQNCEDAVSGFIEDIRITAAAIAGARPSMISISNYINQFLNYIIAASQNINRVDLLRSFAVDKGNQLLTKSRESSLKAAEHGAKTIGSRAAAITCSYSSTVCETFKIAHDNLNHLRVIAAESCYGKNSYGYITAEQLGKHGIAVTVIKDNEIVKYIGGTDLALVGADSILADGTLINGIPTYNLAKACSEEGIPFYCICETAKFDIHKINNNRSKPEPGFEKIPPDLIAGVITEDGIMNPYRVISYIDEVNSLSL